MSKQFVRLLHPYSTHLQAGMVGYILPCINKLGIKSKYLDNGLVNVKWKCKKQTIITHYKQALPDKSLKNERGEHVSRLYNAETLKWVNFSFTFPVPESHIEYVDGNIDKSMDQKGFTIEDLDKFMKDFL